MERLGGTYREVVGDDVGKALVDTARRLSATQIVLGATRRSRFAELTQGSVIRRVIRDSGPISTSTSSATRAQAPVSGRAAGGRPPSRAIVSSPAP